MAQLEITTVIGCPNACDYCPQKRLVTAYAARSAERVMTLDTFRTCLDKIPHYVDLHFSGMAEPWLNPHCTDMVLLAQAAGHTLRVYTTLVGLPAADLPRLEKVPFAAFVVHLPSAGARERIRVDDEYLSVLEQVRGSGIAAMYIHHGEALHPALVERMGGEVKRESLSTRAGNVEGPWAARSKHRGAIKCMRQLRQNVLLPNGDVLLCCMDWGMKHVLGNLVTGDYRGLFTGGEFAAVEHGLADPAADTLCHACDGFAYRGLPPDLAGRAVLLARRVGATIIKPGTGR